MPFALALAAALGPFAGASCARGADAAGSGGSSTTGAGAHGGADPGPGTSSGSNGGGGFINQDDCASGQACDGGVCVDRTCCPEALACADACCNAGEVCSFQKCVTPGAPCHESSDCSAGEYCEYSLGDDADAATARTAGDVARADVCREDDVRELRGLRRRGFPSTAREERRAREGSWLRDRASLA